VLVGSTEFQQYTKSSLLVLNKENSPACIMKNSTMLQECTKKSQIKEGSQVTVLDFLMNYMWYFSVSFLNFHNYYSDMFIVFQCNENNFATHRIILRCHCENMKLKIPDTVRQSFLLKLCT